MTITHILLGLVVIVAIILGTQSLRISSAGGRKPVGTIFPVTPVFYLKLDNQSYYGGNK